MRPARTFKKILLIAILITTGACATPAPKSKPKWMHFPVESVSNLEGMWVNEGGFLRYQIDVEDDQFELIEHSYCPDGDCSNSQESSKGKQVYGTIKDGKISASYIHPGKKYKQHWPKILKCRTLTGEYPVSKATLSEDGEKLFFRIFIPDTNPECSSSKIVFHLIRE
jgi:hypothetical protein